MGQNVIIVCSPDGGFWEEAYKTHFGPLCARASRALTDGNWADAEDLVSEGFWRVMRCYAENPEAIKTLRGYLWVTIKRLAGEKRRKENSAKMDRLEDVMNTKQHPTVEANAEHDVEMKEIAEALQANPGCFSSREIMLFKLHHVEGYKSGEIADKLNEDVRCTYADISALNAKLRRAVTKQKTKTTRQGKP